MFEIFEHGAELHWTVKMISLQSSQCDWVRSCKEGNFDFHTLLSTLYGNPTINSSARKCKDKWITAAINVLWEDIHSYQY